MVPVGSEMTETSVSPPVLQMKLTVSSTRYAAAYDAVAQEILAKESD